MANQSAVWRPCSTCKKPIYFGTKYYVCNVSTCTRKRTGLIFCDVSCWDAHVPMMNHRESWAVETKAPTPEEWERILSGEDKPVRTRKPKEEAPAQEVRPQSPKFILRKKK